MNTSEKSRAIVGALLCSVLGLGYAEAAHAYTSHSGKACVATGGVPGLSPFNVGTSNQSSSTMNAHCPLSLGTQPNACVYVENVHVQYLDRSSDAFFQCQVQQNTYNGLLNYRSPFRYTCSQPGGCPESSANSTFSFKGSGVLTFAIPSGAPSQNCADQDYYVFCFVPPNSTGTPSSIISYYSSP
jgi:hypothetical protein